MVTVGFVVEGDSDEFLPQSPAFRAWLRDEYQLEVLDPVVNAGGNGNLCSHKIGVFVEKLKIQASPDKLVVLADLDPGQCAPCIEARKQLMGAPEVDLVVIARKAIESWFLADTEAMRRWSGNDTFYDPEPEVMTGMPWDRLKQVGRERGRGPGSKIAFARKFIRDHQFDVRRAASHPNCPSARYFVEKLALLGGG
jgi:hypothetical protein